MSKTSDRAEATMARLDSFKDRLLLEGKFMQEGHEKDIHEDIILSVVIPARNEFPNIAHTIHSIINAWESDGYDWQDLEIIIVDNCSDEKSIDERYYTHPLDFGTSSYLEGRGIYVNRLLRTHIDPVAGNHSARNKGAEMARGKYVFFSDAHMSYGQGFFKKMMQATDESGGLVHAAIGWMGGFPPRGGTLGMQYTLKLGEEIKGCVDEQTEILTKDGWKKWNEVDKNTRFATTNKKREIEFQKPIDVLIQKHDGDMYQFTGRSVDAFLTPYHRTPYISDRDKRNGKNEWKEKPAEQIVKSDRLPLATKGIQKKTSPFSDSFVELIGWIITEGSYHTKRTDERITIVQYDEQNRRRIIKCAKDFGYSFHIKKDERKDICIAQKGARKIFEILPEKKLTFEFLNKLSRKQLEILYRTLIDGDGTREDNGGKFVREKFIQKNKDTMDAFQYLCILLGKQSKLSYRKPQKNRFSKDGIFNISVKKNEVASGFKIEKKNYKGIVWCPTLPNGSIFIRRNGKTMPSFNTWAPYVVVPDKWFYIAAQGHCSVMCNRRQFLDFGGYPKYHRSYGGGEFYLDMKWWMFGSSVVVVPDAIGYHLKSYRGYTWYHDDYIHNIYNIGYALEMDAWLERAYLNYIRNGRKEMHDTMMEEAKKEMQKDRDFIKERRVKTFDEVFVESPWDKLNDEKHGKHNSSKMVFHDTWLVNCLRKAPKAIQDLYDNSPLQKKLTELIETKLVDYVYKRGYTG